ncbi:hypothetical protein E3Q18_03186 [Wallemia mellicola]|uniref:2-oxoglutarate dehydrogenase, mitochondrial n=1 Tax=Wallemia mellicola TaxID=1708541 RepID=A0A4T0QUF0_9BASI|nr:hypothetical protein E3Q23_03013 [Wallemia mellicola]TIB96398.1 hypothetical protein E3Q18_03186 [Wallemia mellicola]TIC09793.1 hypothetical protein E3Q14_03198 [Wallemia mellicola]TIC10176.1 hypothetical protein E3Q15_03184 [Wallemia mellicola]TIC28565.1 hypothetical protein E3Q10_03088 [Wallemia mellicola]
MIFYRIEHPDEVVFDEVHFGKYAGYYIKREYYFDVHPPFAKMLNGLAGYLSGFNGDFRFSNINDSYTAGGVPYVGMRSLSAILGSFTIPLIYGIMRESGYPETIGILSATIMLFDNGHVAQTRLILLDAALVFFMALSLYCYIRFSKCRKSPFSMSWWFWQALTGVSLALTLGCKMVGLFTFLTIGMAVAVDLWKILDVRRGYTMNQVTRHVAARAFCLIVIPAAVYLATFWVHFKILKYSGPGDTFMSPRFQETLQGNPVLEHSRNIYYYDSITLKNRDSSNFLNSNFNYYPLRYPDGRVSSQGQVVAGVPHRVKDNYWQILPAEGSVRKDNLKVRNGDIVKLFHQQTSTTLLAHDVASPLTSTNEEFTTWPLNSTHRRPREEEFQIHVLGAEEGDEIRSLASHFKLVHVDTGVSMYMSGKALPSTWAPGQFEVNGKKDQSEQGASWFIDEFNPHPDMKVERKGVTDNKQVKTMNFFKKFFELQLLMLKHNAGLTNPHPYASTPIEWPFQLKGISFWTDNDKQEQIYMIGNVFGAWLSIAAISIFAGIWGADQLSRRRGQEPIEDHVRHRMHYSIGFFVSAWAFHYLPFFLMGRQLFIHHYLPAQLASALVAGAVVNFIATESADWPLTGPYLRTRIQFPREGKIVVALLISALVAAFWFLSPLTYARRTPSITQPRLRKLATTIQEDDGFTGANAFYVEQSGHWKEDHSSVDESWDAYFNSLDGKPPALPSGAAVGEIKEPPNQAFVNTPLDVPKTSSNNLTDHLKVQLLVRAFQVRGHILAKTDPLGIIEPERQKNIPSELELTHYGWSEPDLDTKTFDLGPGILKRFTGTGKTKMTLREIYDTCKQIYCGPIGSQYVHIPEKAQCDWIRDRIETPQPWNYTLEEKRMVLDRLVWSDSFERFIATKFPNEKRFGLEGCESLIPGMKALIDRSVEHGVKSAIIGMPHRGRLNVLANVIRKPGEAIFNEFSPVAPADDDSGGGDVKYHLGANYVRPTPSGKKVSLSLVANPSHLEAENPVVLGKTRALQFFDGDKDRLSAMGILLHGDAAFAAQGVVYETLGFHSLPGYGTGGTIHICVNNQIGFTTDPRLSRSTPYPTDIAKFIDAPIFHVNADDPEAVVFICQLAADWRAKWKKDVVIDLVGYRRHGHNETDQPSFTQPRMYQAIGKKQNILDLYVERLQNEGTFTKQDTDEHKKWVWQMLEKSFQNSREYKPSPKEWLSSSWDGFPTPSELSQLVLPVNATGVREDKLVEIAKALGNVPEGFTIHRNLNRVLKNREKMVQDGKGIDWSTAESLAMGALAMEGNHVRLSGQDVERGTFSQRHSIIHDQKTGEAYMPLNHLGEKQAPVTIVNSTLSEFGVLGFELGYSLVSPDSLTIWEAQFGDFANNAQCMIDQFISSGERKWLQRTGLVLSLPHGYDGQGPEHSSGRIERFLQLCDDNPLVFPSEEQQIRQHQDCNMQVVYPTTPANYFHVLRRQVHRGFRKPLILFFAKSLLRHPMARSDLSELIGDTSFQRYLPDPHPEHLVAPEQVRRHILCSGQVYHTLIKHRDENDIKDVVISRLEQLAPFPYDMLKPHLDKYPNADLYWCQEEPANNGAWSYVSQRLITLVDNTECHKGKMPMRCSFIMSSIDERAVLESIFNANDKGATITIIGFAANSLLTFVKGIAGWYLNSASLLAEATHGTSDMLADVVILSTWTFTRRPFSDRWPLGYGKLETLISSCIAVSMMVASLGVGCHSLSIFYKIVNGCDSEDVPQLNSHAAWFALAGALLKEYLHRKTKSVAKEEASSILLAYAEHHRADALTSLVAFSSILFTAFGFRAIDSVGGILASLSIIISSFRVLICAMYELLDIGVSGEVIEEIRSKAVMSGCTTSVASLRATSSGGKMIVYVSLGLNEKMTSQDISDTSERLRHILTTQRQDIADVIITPIRVDFPLYTKH